MQAAIEQRILTGTTWMGVPALKNPMDAWVYQEIVFELRPDWIVEVGNHAGGSLVYLAELCDLIDHGKVLGVDNNRDEFWRSVITHKRVNTITGDAQAVFRDVSEYVAGSAVVLVIEDSAHTYDHTLAVLRTYSQLVTVGSYLICEDGVMAPVEAALKKFTEEQDSFVPDPSREWPVTWNPGGYLKRVK